MVTYIFDNYIKSAIPWFLSHLIRALQSRDRVIQRKRKSTKSNLVCFVRFRPMEGLNSKMVRYCTSKIGSEKCEWITFNQ